MRLRRWKHREQGHGLFGGSVTISWDRFSPLLMPIVNSWSLTRTRIPIKSGRRRSASMYWKKWGKKRSSGKAKLLRLGAVACAWWMLAGTLAAGADRMKELQDRFDKEAHATSKIKALDKLTDAQFEAARKSGAAGDYNTAGL